MSTIHVHTNEGMVGRFDLPGRFVTFHDFISGEYGSVDSILIPATLRDYRQSSDASLVQNLLDDIFAAIRDDRHLELDFVIGTTDDGRFIPLDGQQRLITLFLVELCLARLADEPLDELQGRLEYQSRKASRQIIEKLINSLPELETEYLPRIKTIIEDQIWFSSEFQTDPVVSSLLETLVLIGERAVRLDDPQEAYESFCRNIGFNLLELGNEDVDKNRLYLRMNSRGLMPSHFESFRLGLLGRLRSLGISDELIDEFSHKLAGPWTDFVWQCRNKDFDFGDFNYNDLDRRFASLFLCYLRLEARKLRLIAGPAEADVSDESDACADEMLALAEKLFTAKDGEERLSRLILIMDRLASIEDFEKYFDQIFTTGEVQINFEDSFPNWALFDSSQMTARRQIFASAIFAYAASPSFGNRETFIERFRIICNLTSNYLSGDDNLISWKTLLAIEKIMTEGIIDPSLDGFDPR